MNCLRYSMFQSIDSCIHFVYLFWGETWCWVLFDPHGFTECFDKVSHESRVSVRYYIICLGIPYQGKRCWRYSSVTPSPVISLLHGMNLVTLKHPWSTMVRIVSYPLDFGRSVMKSMEPYWKGPSSAGVLKLCKGAWGSQIVLLSWHLAHPLTYCSTYSLSLGPWYFCLTKSRVLDIPGWPPVGASWMFLRICCHFWGLFGR